MDNMEGEFSREFKEQIKVNRCNDWNELQKWLNEQKIEFYKNEFNIEIYENGKMITVFDNMKVSFGNSKKYQYNLDGIKKRIQK